MTGNSSFPCSTDHEQDWQRYPVGLYYSAISDDQTYILIRNAVSSAQAQQSDNRFYLYYLLLLPLGLYFYDTTIDTN